MFVMLQIFKRSCYNIRNKLFNIYVLNPVCANDIVLDYDYNVTSAKQLLIKRSSTKAT